VIGDTVNTVFRLEILTKEMDRTVIASEGFVSRLTESAAFDDIGE
jgi:class 3 adenylate cyclase